MNKVELLLHKAIVFAKLEIAQYIMEELIHIGEYFNLGEGLINSFQEVSNKIDAITQSLKKSIGDEE